MGSTVSGNHSTYNGHALNLKINSVSLYIHVRVALSVAVGDNLSS